jgi:hypothetical protein
VCGCRGLNEWRTGEITCQGSMAGHRYSEGRYWGARLSHNHTILYKYSVALYSDANSGGSALPLYPSARFRNQTFFALFRFCLSQAAGTCLFAFPSLVVAMSRAGCGSHPNQIEHGGVNPILFGRERLSPFFSHFDATPSLAQPRLKSCPLFILPN